MLPLNKTWQKYEEAVFIALPFQNGKHSNHFQYQADKIKHKRQPNRPDCYL